MQPNSSAFHFIGSTKKNHPRMLGITKEKRIIHVRGFDPMGYWKESSNRELVPGLVANTYDRNEVNLEL